jgi:hypothetical protein
MLTHTPVDTFSNSLLDVCAQELFVALMVSLMDLDLAPIGLASFVLKEDSARLEHPIVAIFADAFVEGGLGTYFDATLCIVPALRDKMSPLALEDMIPALVELATRYRKRCTLRFSTPVLCSLQTSTLYLRR